MENKDQSNAVLTGAISNQSPLDYGVVKEPPSDLNALSLDPGAEPLIPQEQQPKSEANVFLRFARRLDVMLAILLLLAGAVVLFSVTRKNNTNDAKSSDNTFGTVEIPLGEIIAGKDLSLSGIANVTINGTMQLNSGLLLSPSVQPTGAVAGQIYYDQGTNQLAYFNGEVFVFLTSPETAGGVQSLGGGTGLLTLGSGLNLTNNQLSNNGVLSVQGQGGNISLTAGPGIVINGTNFSNSGVVSVAAGTPNVTVANDGSGNVTISVAAPVAGTGTITSSGGSAGTIPLFTASQNIEDSIVTQSGLTVTISGDLSVVTGGLTLSNALSVSNGGTGATSLASNGVLVGNGTAAVSAVGAGAPGLCLVSTAGAPTWAACPGGGGVTSLNGLAGALSIANASAAGSTITIDDASTVNKGIASFNSTNFTAAAGAINTIQNINSGATPTFAGVNTNSITPSSALTVGVSAQTALLQGSTTTITSNGVGNNIVLNSAATIELQDNTNVTGDLATSGDVAVNGGDITSTGALNITPGGALTVGTSSQVLTLQGGATTSFRATSGANTTIVAFTTPTANTTLNFPALAAGTYTICTTSGNCAGAGVTLQAAYTNSTSPEITLDATRGALTIRDNAAPIGANLLEVQDNSGATTYLAVTSSGAAVTGTATATGTINSSGGSIQTNGTTRVDNSGNLINIAAVTASGSATFQGGAVTLGTNAQAGTIVLNDGSSNTGTLQVAALGQNTIYTLPDPGIGAATICLTTGNCAGSGTGVTTGGGTTNQLAKFSGSQAIADSTISDDGTTVTTSVDLVIQGGTGTIGVAGTQSGSLVLAFGGAAFTGTILTDTLTANQTYTLPNASGSFCLTSGNCAGVGGTGDILQGGNNFGTAVTIGANDAFALNLETGGVTRLTIAADGSQATLSSNMDLILQGATAYISNSQGQTNAEAFGMNASVTGANGLAVGNGAAAANNGVSVGYLAGASSGAFGGPVSIGEGANAGSWGVAVGQGSSTSGNDATAIGNSAAAGQEAVALGMSSSANLNGVALGYGATTGGNNRIVIGHNATATADNQLVIGSGDSEIDHAIIGNGVSSATPIGFRLQGTSGSGADIAGATVTIASGAGTGSAAGGNIDLQVATPGVSGSSANVLATVLSLSGTNGSALFKNVVNSASAFEVQTAGGAAVLTVNTSTSGVTVAGDLAVNGGDITSTGALNITPGGVLTVGATGQQLILQGSANTQLTATGGGFTTTVGFTGTPTGAITYNFDRAATGGTYTICTTVGNCAGTGGGVTTLGGTTGTLPKFTGAQTLGDSLLSESGSTMTVNGNLNLVSGNQFQVNGTQISSANLSNDANLAKLSASQTFTGNTVAFQNAANSTNAFNIQNQAGNRVLTVDTTGGQLLLGLASTLDGKVVFSSVSNANTVTVLPGTLTGNRTLTLPDASGIICTDSGNCAGAGATLQTGYNFSVGGTTPKIKVNSGLGGVDIQDADTPIGANLFNIRESNAAGLGSVMFGVGNTGQVTLQNSANSTTALRLLTQGGTSVLTGDTTNGAIILGQSGTLSGSLIFNNATNANTTTIALTTPSVNRTITLPNATGTICLSSGNCSGAGSSNTLQAAYDAGNTILTSDSRDIQFQLADTATDANFTIDLQCDTSCGGNGRFAIQDDGIDVFTVSPAGGAVAISGALAANGNVILGDAAADLITFGGTIQGTNALVFEGSVADGNETTFVITNPTAPRTVTFGDETGVVCLQSSVNCGFLTGSASDYIQNSTGGPQTANFNITSGAATNLPTARIVQVNNSTAGGRGLLVVAGSTPGENVFEVQNSSTNQIFAVDASNTRVIVGSNCTNGRLCVGQSTTGSGSSTAINSYNQQTINMSGGTGTWINQNIIMTDTSSAISTTLRPLVIDTSTTTNTSATINSIDVTVPTNASGNFMTLRNGSTDALNITNGGSMTLRTVTNGTSAFRLQDSSGAALLNADTTNGWVINNGSSHPGNLLENPSFESNGSFTASGWNFSSAGTISAAGTPHHGNREFAYTPNGTQLILSSLKYLSAQPGDQFYAEVWYKAAVGTNGAASFSFSYYDKDKVNIGSSAVTNFSNSQTSYANAIVTGTAPANTVYVRLTTGITSASTTGTWFFDDYYLAKVTNQAPQLFKNTSNSTSALQIQNASGEQLVNVDSNSSIISLANGHSGRLQSFQSETDLISPRENGGSATLNGYLYIFGGCNATSTRTTTVQYAKLNADGTTGAWSTTTSLPATGAGYCGTSATAYNGRLYVHGGGANTTDSQRIYYARPNADGTITSWTTNAINGQDAATPSIVTYNGYLYELGTTTDDLWYAPINADGSVGTFTMVTNWLGAARDATAAVIANGFLYAIGGNNGGTNTVYYGKIRSDGSVGTPAGAAGAAGTTTVLPTSLSWSDALVANGYMYVLGGWNGSASVNTVYYAQINANGTLSSWSSNTTLPAVRNAGATYFVNGYIYYVGGFTGSGGQDNSWYTALPSVRLNGSLDLVGIGSENLNEGGSGGQLTAGNTDIIGDLNVRHNAAFLQDVAVARNLNVGGEINTATLSGAGLTDCDSTNSKLLYDATTKQFSCGTDRASATVYKTNDETVNNSAALQNDDVLSFSVGANETWAYQIFLAVDSTAAAGFSNAVSAPTGSTCRQDSNDLYEVINETTTTCGTQLFHTHTDNADHQYLIYGTIATGGTAGTAQFRWAQHTATAVNTVVRGRTFMVAYKVTGADLAEAYYTNDNTISPGDIVQIDSSLKAGVKKSDQPYQSQAMGIISTQPGYVLSDGIPSEGRPVLLALSGRVPLKVSLENGPIEAGDYLTTSSTPGVAMKATKPGQMIGKAMEAFSSDNPEAQGVVMTFANLTYADPNSSATANNDLQNSTFGDLNASGVITTKDLVVTNKATIADLVVGTMSVKDITITGSANIVGDLNLQGVGKSRNAITKKFIASKHIPIGAVVIIDPVNDGQVTTTSVMADTRVLGVALTKAESGEEVTVAIGGSVQVKAANGALIQGGDLLVSSSQEGAAEKSTSPGVGSMIGKALGKSDDNGELVWVIISLQ